MEIVQCEECGGDDLYPYGFDEFELMGYFCKDCDDFVEVRFIDE